MTRSALIPAPAEYGAALVEPSPAIALAARIGDPRLREQIMGWAGAAMSVAILVAVWIGLGDAGLWRVIAIAPALPAFWMLFAAYYLLGPAVDWVIFRRLWNLPAAGFAALLRKHVANELVLGYSGEAQFYLWARRHVPMAGSPFGAVKDVAVLSALAGNIATLVMMAALAPLLMTLFSGPMARSFAGSVAIVAASSLVIFVLRRSIFALGRRMLQFVFAMQIARIVATVVLSAAMWHLLLPSVEVSWWAALATLRLMISRLPLVPNKDVLFAGVVVLMLGPGGELPTITALMASLVVATHLAIGAITGGTYLVGRIMKR